MISELVRDLHVLTRADSLVGRVWLRFIVRQFSLFMLAGLIGLFGLAMTSVAVFYALQPHFGPVAAAAIIAVADFALAGIVIVVTERSEPGAAMDQACAVRKEAIESLQADAHDLQLTITALAQDIRDAKDSIIEFVRNPLDAAVHKLLVPAAKSIIDGLLSKKDPA